MKSHICLVVNWNRVESRRLRSRVSSTGTPAKSGLHRILVQFDIEGPVKPTFSTLPYPRAIAFGFLEAISGDKC